MSHRHWCDYTGHFWDCAGSALRPLAGDREPSACFCLRHQVPMEDGDHSQCSIELLACPEHLEARLQAMDTTRTDRQTVEPTDWLEQMFAEMNTPEAKLKFERERQFEREVLYAGLTNLNTGFDSPLVEHFSPEDCLIVIDRCESLGVEVIGVEVFTTDVAPPYKTGLEDIEISPVPGYDWARRFVREYMEESGITISVTFDVPDALLKSNPKQEGEPNQ